MLVLRINCGSSGRVTLASNHGAISLQAGHLFSYCTDIEVYGDLFSFPHSRIIFLIIFRKTRIYDCCLYPVTPMLSWNSASKKVITAANPQSWVPGIARLNKPIITETANSCSCLSPWLCPEGLKSLFCNESCESVRAFTDCHRFATVLEVFVGCYYLLPVWVRSLSFQQMWLMLLPG